MYGEALTPHSAPEVVTALTPYAASEGTTSKRARLEGPAARVLSQGRVEALLKGTVSVFDQGFARAYRSALSKLGSKDSGDGPKDEFSALEMCSLFVAGGDLRKLAVFVLHQLALSAAAGDSASAESIHACVSNGVLNAISESLLELITSRSDDSFDQVSAAVQFLLAVSSPEYLPDNAEHGLSMRQIVSLHSCVAELMVGALVVKGEDGSAADADADAAAARLECSVTLMKAVRFLRTHASSDRDGIYDEVYKANGALNSARVVNAALAILRKHPTHAGAGTLARFVLAGGTEIVPFLATLSEIEGYKQIVDLASSTTLSEEALCWVLAALGNIAGAADESYSNALVENDALLMLQPAIMHSNPNISLQASCTLARLGSQKRFAEAFASSGAEAALSDAMQMFTPGMAKSGINYGGGDVPIICAMLSQDLNPVFNLATLLDVTCAIEVVDGKLSSNTTALSSSPQFITALRVCASSPSAFVYSAACFVLRAFDLPVPSFRGGGLSSRDDTADILRLDDADRWSIDQVCQWVGNQPFKAYRQAFRDNLVSGALLLSVTDEDLASMGIAKVLHRKAILHATGVLSSTAASASAAAAAAAASGAGSGPGTRSEAALVLALGPRASTSARFDVFISYRRVGGADFAQLVKLTLERKGLSVFLDIDNLGTGNFDAKLEASLLASTNIVMVWTKGCMDRFMDGKDAVRADFVRKEYALALLHKKNIVPLYKEDFEFPPANRLPEDVRGVLFINSIKFVGEYREATFDKLVKAMVPRA